MQAASMESDTQSDEGCDETGHSMGSSLPEELVQLVLQRLPLESVMRFRFVCKEWNNLFMSSAFSHSFCHKAGKLVPLYLDELTISVYDTRNRSWFQHELDTSLDQLSFLKDPDVYLELVASGGGLLCFMVRNIIDHDYFVYNPLTQQCHRLPRMIYELDEASVLSLQFALVDRKMLCGIDADLETGYYSFVILDPGSSNREGMTLIYDSRLRSWRQGSKLPMSVRMLDEYTEPCGINMSTGCKSHCVTWRGKFHWLVGSGPDVNQNQDLVHIYDIKLDRWSYVKCSVLNERMTFLRCMEHKGEVLVVGKRGPRHSKKPFCYFEILETESSSGSMDVREFYLQEKAMPMDMMVNVLDSFQIEGKTEARPSWCLGANDEVIFLLDAQSFDSKLSGARRSFLFSSPMVRYSGHGVDSWSSLTNWKILKHGSSSLKPYASYGVWTFQPSLVSP